MALDLSEAPEGATHYGYGEHCPFWIKDYRPGVGYQFMNDSRSRHEWLVRLGDPEPKIYPIPLISKSNAWNGKGRPSVGDVCGLMFKGVDQGEVTVLFMSQEVGVFNSHTFGHDQCGDLIHYEFYQSITPEQIATEERDKASLELAGILAGHDQHIAVRDIEMAKYLFDIGYRKQVTP